jgi:hypothetical protein
MATVTGRVLRGVRTMDRARFPDFQPHPLLLNPHAQTLAGVYLPGSKSTYRATPRYLHMADGDTLVLHDDRPGDWRPGGRVVLLIHGLGGSYQSGYMSRIASKLNQHALRTFRMDMRGFGAGFGLARHPFHGGRSDDLAAAVEYIGRLCPASPVTLVGFSLGAGMIIKLLGELTLEPGNARGTSEIDSAVAVCPPLDLLHCSRRMSEPGNRFYNRHFLSLLVSQLHRHRQARPDSGLSALARRPRSVYEFDDLFTGPACGFGTADNYYHQTSAGRFLPHVRLPCLVLKAADDPLVDHDDPRDLDLPACVQWETTVGGGHLGFIARRGLLPDRRWMDWRVVDWVTRFDGARPSAIATPHCGR